MPPTDVEIPTDIRADMANMPRYRCHKIVHALKIKEVKHWPAGGAQLIFEEPGFGPLSVNASYLSRNPVQAGGYFVVYQDGYQSWSPAKAFEEGYTRIEEPKRFVDPGKPSE